MNLQWYYQRLRSMSLGEVFWRIRRLGWQIRSWILRGYDEQQFRRSSKPSVRICQSLDAIAFYGVPTVLPENYPQSWRERTLQQAEFLMNHWFQCFDLEPFQMGPTIQWNREWKRSLNLPLAYSPWMDYRDTNRLGHFKYFWEPARFQHLITLAKAYFLTRDKKYAQEVESQISSFLDQCPYLRGVHWTMAMEAGLRLLSVVWIVAFLKEYLSERPSFCQRMEELIFSHLYFITKNYSFYSSANNHLIAEAAGVFVTSLCFQSLGGMEKYQRQAGKILCEEMEKQFFPDGVNREQTVHYQISCLNTLLLSGILARQNQMDFPAAYWQRLEKAVEFIASIADEDCTVPAIGDSDDGKTIVLSECDYHQVQSLLATAAVLFHRPDFKKKARFFDEMSFWLLGEEGWHQFERLSDKAKQGPLQFPEGGYYLLKLEQKPNVQILFDCGPLGYGTIAGHGHADALSLVVRVAGKDFLIDPGTGTYEYNSPFRNYFRSTRAHNTVVIDGRDQSEMRGPFLWGKRANASVEEWILQPDRLRVVGRHDGYANQKDPVLCRRTLELDKTSRILAILDQIECRQSHEIRQYFHCGIGAQLEQNGTQLWRIIQDDLGIEIEFDPRVTCRTYWGSVNPCSGWASPGYGRIVPIWTIECTYQTENNCELKTMIRF